MDPELPSSILSGASKLNTQILAYTLLLASANDEFCRNDPPTIRSRTARFASQVNCHWREVALGQQELWLGPVLTTAWYSAPHWLDVVLKRSYPLPLDAVIPPRSPSDSVRLFIKHLPRIRSLKLTANIHVGWLAEELRHQHKPLLLERFAISISSAGAHPGRSLRPCDLNPVFCGYAPMLQQLEIHNYPLNISPKLFQGLRVLVFDIMHRSSFVQLLDSLRNMDQLEELHVAQPTENDVSRSTLSVSSPLDEPFFLHRLKALSISAPLSVCANIFRNITIRDSCSIMLRCRNACNSRDLRDILSRLKSTLSNWRCDALTGRQSVDIGGTYIQFALHGPHNDDELCPSIDLKVSGSSFDEIFAIFPRIASTFQSCKNLPETLDLYSAPDVPSEVKPLLHEWLGRLDYLQAVKFHGHEAFGFYFPLLGSCESRSRYLGIRSSDLDDILLPDLGDLIMVGVNFTSQKRLHWRRLLKTLRFRDKVGQPILLVDFVDCIGDFDQNIPGRLGVVVKVNGVDLTSDSEDDGEDSDYTVQGQSD